MLDFTLHLPLSQQQTMPLTAGVSQHKQWRNFKGVQTKI